MVNMEQLKKVYDTADSATKKQILNLLKDIARKDKAKKYAALSTLAEEKAKAKRKTDAQKLIKKLGTTPKNAQPCKAQGNKRDKALTGPVSLAFAQKKFETFNQLNRDIYAKVSEGMTSVEKLALTRQRVISQRAKAAIVARQSHLLVEEIGAGSCNGFFNDQNVKLARGREKIKKTGSAPSVRFKGE